MVDIETVIEALGCIVGQKRSCEGCPYFIAATPDLGGFSYGYCAKGNVAKDAIALLKEQEPVKPKWASGIKGSEALCGSCMAWLSDHSWAYCPRCGRKVKWDE